MCGTRPALSYDQGDVVLLLVRTESAHLVDDGSHELVRGKTAVPGETIDKALFTILLVVAVAGFGDAVGVKR